MRSIEVTYKRDVPNPDYPKSIGIRYVLKGAIEPLPTEYDKPMFIIVEGHGELLSIQGEYANVLDYRTGEFLALHLSCVRAVIHDSVLEAAKKP